MIKVNGHKVQFGKFPNGETHVKHDSIHSGRGQVNTEVHFKYESDASLLELMFVKNYLDIHCKSDKINLIIFYMPYSRQDRVEEKSAFTLKYVSKFINDMKFNKINVIEPHSDVTVALLDNAESKYINFNLLSKVIDEVGFDVDNDYIVFPDATANKRYGSVKIKNQLTGIKHRNFETGKIESLELAGSVNHEGFKAIMIDDLCSFGNTFLMTAEKLKELGANEIYLLVGHCEDSIFNGNILKTELIKKTFTTDTILLKNNDWSNIIYKDKLKIYNILEMI